MLHKTFTLLFCITLCASALAAEGRITENWNYGWTFSKVEPGAERSEPVNSMKVGDALIPEKLQESQPVRLPHDWAIEGPFDEKSQDGGQGKLPWRSVGWYFKTLKTTEADANRAFILNFDGVMCFPEVYVNGTYVGGWDYGYVPFQIDVTKFLKFGTENEIAVRCDARRHGSRWYPGAGIYRGVTLIKTSAEARIPDGGVFISTPEVSANSAKVTVRVQAQIDLQKLSRPLYADAEIFTPSGELAASLISAPLNQEGGTRGELKLNVKNPRLWSPDAPNLYRLKVTLKTDAECPDRNLPASQTCARVFDQVEQTFGIRSVEWTADDGFHLNGKRLQLYGVDLHHDQGILGAASHPVAIERQLRIMKEMGVNAIRTSHNPNSAAFMDACDRLGFIVWNELFDKWDATVDLFDQTTFDEFTERQVRQFVHRDQNRPSVCVWSIGNEIFDVEQGRKGSSNPYLDGPRRVTHVVNCYKKYDPTRKVALGCCVSGTCVPSDHTRDALDVIGWNYNAQYRTPHATYPQKAMVYSESASAVSTRGFYQLPHPASKKVYDENHHQVDGYDWCSVPWGDIPDVEFDRMEKDRYVAGEFVWTGFDYLGEPSPFNKEARSSYFGIVDLCGIPKDRYFIYRAYWNPEALTVHILPHWNWNAGDEVPVYVYTNGDSAELFLNGRSLGKRAKLKEIPKFENETKKFSDSIQLTASTEENRPDHVNPVAGALDGDAETRWCAANESPDQWLQLDFGKPVAAKRQVIVMEQSPENYSFRVESSQDGQNWTKLHEHRFAKSDGDQVEVNAANAQPARYFRVVFDGLKPGTWASIREWSFTDKESAGQKTPAYYAVIDKYRLRWENVPFEAGKIEAVAYKDGKEIGRATVQTAGADAAMRLTPEKTQFTGDDDLAYILVEAVDARGTLCPNSMRKFSVSVDGPAELVGIGNGNPMGYEPITDAEHSLFYGKAMIVLRSHAGAGPVKLTVTSDGVKGDAAVIRK